MYKILFFISFIILLFTACSSPSALVHFNKSDLQKKAVQNSKKADIVANSAVEVIVWATYLNPIDELYEDGSEKFLVSTYFSGKTNHNFLEKDYKFTLNEKEAFNIKKLNKNDNLVKNLKVNPWASYYLIEFKEVGKKVYDLKLEFSKEKKKTTLSFQK